MNGFIDARGLAGAVQMREGNRMNAPEYPRLEPQQISTEVLIEKYAKNGETALDEVRSRVARALAQVEPVGEREELEAQFE